MELRLTTIQATFLQYIRNHPNSYGLQMVREIPSANRSSIYVHLNRMEDRGLIESKPEAPTDGEQGPVRRTYKITGKGARSLAAWAVYQEASDETLLDGGEAVV